MPAPAIIAMLMVVMLVIMTMSVGMVMVVATATRVIMTATIVGFLAAALPAREQDEEKSGGEHEGDDDRQVHTIT